MKLRENPIRFQLDTQFCVKCQFFFVKSGELLHN